MSDAAQLLQELIKVTEAVKSERATGKQIPAWYINAYKVVRRAFILMTDLEFKIEQTELIRQENKFLKQYLQNIETELLMYKGIERAKTSGVFDEIERKVDEYIKFRTNGQ